MYRHVKKFSLSVVQDMPEVSHSYFISVVFSLVILFWIFKSTETSTISLCETFDDEISLNKIRNLTRQLDENNQKWREIEETLKTNLHEVRRQLLDVKRTNFRLKIVDPKK